MLTLKQIMSYWVHIMGGLGIVTSRPRLQGGTGNDLVVGIPPGGGVPVLQLRMWWCCCPVVVVQHVTFTCHFR